MDVSSASSRLHAGRSARAGRPPAHLGVPGRHVPATAAVAAHRRAGGPIGFWSIRTQLLAPIVVATIGLAILGTVQTAAAVGRARDAGRAKVLAGTATATVRLAHEIDRELAETAAFRQRGGTSGEALVSAQRARVDRALLRYRSAATAAGRDAANLAPSLDAAEVALGGLAGARSAVVTGSASGVAAQRTYTEIVGSLLALADALPAQLREPRLAAAAREVATVAGIEHDNALERDLLRPVFSRGALQPGELAAVASVDGALRQREAEFARVATASAKQTYDTGVTSRDVENSRSMRTAALAGDVDPTGLKVDADAWYVAASNTIRRLNDVGLTLSDRLDSAARQISTDAYRQAWLIGLGTAGLALAVLAAAVILAVRTSRRLRRLRAAALIVARDELPERIAAVTAGVPVDDHTAGDSPASAATRRIAASDDEVGEVADAFGSVHRTALRLAAEQAELRLDVVRMAEIFARRIRTLITRQLRLLDEFEREETDPEALSRLFALDHIAARLRRNGENLLVLAGGEPGRPYASAFPLAGAVKAAASEIEDFQRVETAAMEVAVTGSVVGDLVHLLAELLENATTFSPPDTTVRVDARSTADGVALRVHDDGLGLTPAKLAEVNARLAAPTVLSSAAAGTMGLYVVARLAARHGITVRIYPAERGTDAYVLLPPEVLGPLWATAPSQQLPQVTSDATTRSRWATVSRQSRPPAKRLTWQSGTPAVQPAGSPTTGDVDAPPPVQERPVDGPLTSSPTAAWFRPYMPGNGQQPGVVTGATAAPGAAGAAVAINGNGSWPANTPAAGAPAATPAAAADAATEDGTVDGSADPTENGLPRRRPGASRTAISTSIDADRTGAAGTATTTTTAPPDPDEVRARLSALAEGVSAALRRSNQPTPASKDQ